MRESPKATSLRMLGYQKPANRCQKPTEHQHWQPSMTHFQKAAYLRHPLPTQHFLKAINHMNSFGMRASAAMLAPKVNCRAVRQLSKHPVSTTRTASTSTQHGHPAPAPCLHHARSQHSTQHRQASSQHPAPPQPAPAPGTGTLSRKRAQAAHCYLK